MTEHCEGPSAVDHALLSREMELLRTDFDALAASVQGLVDAWKTATGLLAVIKWLAATATLLGGAWAVLKVKFGA